MGKALCGKASLVVLFLFPAAAVCLPAAPARAERPVCGGTPADCLSPSYGWGYDGEAIDVPTLFDVTITRLADGRYRLYGENGKKCESYISNDGLNFEKEDGNRLEPVFMPFIVKLPDGRFRLYYTDQTQTIGEEGGRAIRSAVSDDGLNFTVEDGDRLTYSGSGYEEGGIRGAKILPLPDGSYRMYYHGIDGALHWRVLSAVSDNGLNWTREPGVRLDPSAFCPPVTRIGNVGPWIDAAGIYHLYIAMNRCGAGFSDEKPGIYDCYSFDGLSFAAGSEPIVRDYFKAGSYTGKPTDPKVTPQDPAVIMSDEGLRIYFGLYDGPNLIDESGIYSITRDIVRPKVKANGQAGAVTVEPGQALSLKVSLDIEGGTGPRSDWWLAARTPSGWFHYEHEKGGGSWKAGLAPAYQGALFDLSPFEALNRSGLLAGLYSVIFGVDTAPDGKLNPDTLIADSVDVKIE